MALDHPSVRPYRFSRRISYEEFRARVRRHRPSELLPLKARVAIHYGEPDTYLRDSHRLVAPWALGVAAKKSIVWGNESRASGVTDNDILEMCGAFAELRDPLELHEGTIQSTAAQFLIRMGNEQFGFQMSPSEEVGRVRAMFGMGLDSVKTEVITEATLRTLLGCSVEE